MNIRRLEKKIARNGIAVFFQQPLTPTFYQNCTRRTRVSYFFYFHVDFYDDYYKTASNYRSEAPPVINTDDNSDNNNCQKKKNISHRSVTFFINVGGEGEGWAERNVTFLAKTFRTEPICNSAASRRPPPKQPKRSINI